MDEETAKTIADLKAQMQSLMDEVKKLKSQQNADSSTARLRPPSGDQAKKKTEPVPLNPHPIGYTPFLSPQVREQTSMEEQIEGTTEFAPKSEQQEQMNLPMVDASENGLIFRSEDNHHLVRLGGLLQLDDREFVDPGTTDMSKFLIRRARPYVAGYFYDDWEYRFAPEFALSSPNATSYQTTIADAYINYDTIDEIQVQAGKFTVPVGLEMLTPAAFLPFSERSLTSNLIPNRDLGVMTHGSLFSYKLSWAAMVGAGARNDTVQSGLDYGTGPVGYFRLYSQPFRGEQGSQKNFEVFISVWAVASVGSLRTTPSAPRIYSRTIVPTVAIRSSVFQTDWVFREKSGDSVLKSTTTTGHSNAGPNSQPSSKELTPQVFMDPPEVALPTTRPPHGMPKSIGLSPANSQPSAASFQISPLILPRGYRCVGN